MKLYENKISITVLGREVEVIVKSVDKYALRDVANAVENARDEGTGSLNTERVFDLELKEAQ